MGSAFDSEVYAERQRLPGVTIGVSKLMQHLLWSLEDGHVEVKVERRSDVDTSMWWTVNWGVGFDGGGWKGSVSATTLELALFRAAVIARRDDDRSKKYAGGF